jgi:hypothetical protein
LQALQSSVPSVWQSVPAAPPAVAEIVAVPLLQVQTLDRQQLLRSGSTKHVAVLQNADVNTLEDVTGHDFAHLFPPDVIDSPCSTKPSCVSAQDIFGLQDCPSK